MSVDADVVRRGLAAVDGLAGDLEALVVDLSGPGPVVCLTAGVSGSGKTTVAGALEAGGFVRLSIDGLRWEAGGPDLADDDYGEAVERDLEARLSRLVAEGRDVVVDVAACSRPARDRYREVVRAGGGRLVLVHLEAEPATLSARLAGRAWRHADDVPVPPDVLARYLAGFDPPGDDEHPHRFRTDRADGTT